MLDVRPFDSLGKFRNGWLNASHHFSFAGYHDPDRVSFGPLRVWNDDTIRPGTGFDMHGHRDMEIITYVRRGAITHKDHLGNVGRTEAGDIQVMSAGTGIMHAEFNYEDEDTQIFQIWVIPDRQGHAPRWEAMPFPKGAKSGRLIPLASGEDRFRDNGDVLGIHQDATLYGADLGEDDRITHVLAEGRRAYLVPSEADVTVNGTPVRVRSGLAVSNVEELEIVAGGRTDLLLFDLP
jgi:hypothetical protein